MEVAREVEVDALHGEHLCVAPAGGTALHAEAGSERWFAERHAGALADGVESEAQADAHGSLADTGAGGGDGRDEHELAPSVGVDEVEGEFGYVFAIAFDMFGRDAELLRHLLDGQEFRLVCDFDIRFHDY